MTTAINQDGLVEFGRIVSAHGLRGQFKIATSWEHLSSIAELIVCTPDHLERLDVTRLSRVKGGVLCQVEGVANRTQAEALVDTITMVHSACLPPLAANEYYCQDLIGKMVASPQGDYIGRVNGFYDFGAGDIIEVEVSSEFLHHHGIVRNSKLAMVNFDDSTVDQVNVANGNDSITAAQEIMLTDAGLEILLATIKQ